MSVRATILALFGGLTVCCATCEASPSIRCAADLFRSTCVDRRQIRGFDFTARITASLCSPDKRKFVIDDPSGAVLIYCTDEQPALKAGDRVRISGIVHSSAGGPAYASCTNCTFLDHGPVARPKTVAHGQFDSGRYDCQLVTVSGSVIDAFIDETDPNFVFYILNSDGERITVATETSGRSASDCEQAIDCTLSVVGICRPHEKGERAQLGRYIRCLPDQVRLSGQASTSPFDVPEVQSARVSEPAKISSLERRRLRGRVLAVWQGDHALIRTEHDKLASISIAFGPLPKCGATIEASGFPETDFYQTNLTRCRWRPSTPLAGDAAPATPVDVRSLFTDASGRRRFNTHYHGRRVVFTGRIRNLPHPDGDASRVLVESGGSLLTIDVSACPSVVGRLQTDSLVDICGVCVMETESWRPSNPFPHVKGLFVSVAADEDIRILANPPWWTPGKLCAVIGGLLLVCCASLVWIFSLRRIVAARERALKTEITARLASDLKSHERTRLAVELHDSIVQNLSGMSMEISTAQQLAVRDPDAMHRHLDIVSKTLRSCRAELRDCLWDLRSKALEDEDMNSAIRTTLFQLANGIRLLVRFNVPRRALSDNVAHALLRIVRELVSNAVRHGHATEVRIAGQLEGQRLSFSVQDNGCGFDTASRPGIVQGHFGLQGVHERARRFNGELKIASSPGRGTKATVSIDIIPPEEENASTP